MSTDRGTITVAGIRVEVIRKDIKNLHLGVYPPNGRVRVAVPQSVSDDAARLAVIDKLGWVKRQRAKFAEQPRLPRPEAVTGESWYVFGQRMRLNVLPTDGQARVVRPTKGRLELHAPADMTEQARVATLDRWQRRELRREVTALVEQWAPVVGVRPASVGIRRMRTKWGSCSTSAGHIWLNAELAKKSRSCIEYIVVHELVHLLEPNHGERFLALMDLHLPSWRARRDELNRAPLAHEDWDY